MSRRANEERAKRVEQYYIRHGLDKKKTYTHFTDEGLCKKTIYHILRRHDQRGDVSFKKPTGRRVTVCTTEMFDRLANIFKENPDLSCREAAKQLGVARTTIFRIMKKMREKNLETYKVIESEPRCPTCHQKIENKALKGLKKTRTIKKIKPEDDAGDESDPDEEEDDDDGQEDDEDTKRNIRTLVQMQKGLS